MRAGPPKFKVDEIHSLFEFLKYPYQIRNDAITAVGAPSSIQYLIKALYWLYTLADTQLLAPKTETSKIDDILEESKEEESMIIDQVPSQENDIFKQLLDEILI